MVLTNRCIPAPSPTTTRLQDRMWGRVRRAALAKRRAEKSIRRPRKDERAAATRNRSDDTISPLGDSKKLRPGDPDRQPPSFARVAKTKIGMVITTPRTGRLDGATADKFLSLKPPYPKKDHREDLLASATGLTFKGNPSYLDGSLRLWCADQRMVAWLRSAISLVIR